MHAQINDMNSRHVAGLEVLERNHAESLAKLKQELERAKGHTEM
jgi:hypothetical protein